MILVMASMLALAQTAADPAPATPPGATPSGQAAPVASAMARKTKPKMICEEQEEIGSRLSKKRICHTPEEWREIRASERRDIERVQSGRIGGG